MLLPFHSDNHSNIHCKLLLSISIILWEFSTSIFDGEPWFPDHCFPSTPRPHPQAPRFSSVAPTINTAVNWLQIWVQFSTLPLQCDFAASLIMIRGLFPCCLNLAWWLALTKRMQWRWRWTSSEAWRGLRYFHSHRRSPAAPGRQVWVCLVGGWDTMWKRVHLPNWDHPSFRPPTPKHVREPIQAQQKCLSNPWKNEWAQPRREEPFNWPVDTWKMITTYCFGPLKLEVFCYAAVADRYNHKEQDCWSESLWLVHWAVWAGHLLHLLLSCIHCTEPLCPPCYHPKLPKFSSHHTRGPQWVTFVSAVWAPFWRQWQPHGGEEISLCPFQPLSPTMGQVILLGFKAARVARSSQVLGSLWDRQAHSQTRGTLPQGRPGLPQELPLTHSLRTHGWRAAWQSPQGHRTSQLVGSRQLSVWPQPKPEVPQVLTESTNWTFLLKVLPYRLLQTFQMLYRKPFFSKLVNVVSSANWPLSTLIFDNGFVKLTQSPVPASSCHHHGPRRAHR